MGRLSRFCIALAPFLVLGASHAAAEPQILGVIASLEPVTLQCARGECSAEFSSYCIERHRKSPIWGTAYTIHDPATLTLEGVRKDGTTIALSVVEHLSIASARGRSAISMSLPSSLLLDYDLASVQVSVGERATLIPEPIVGARRPHTEADIALATGPLRDAAAAIIDRGGETVGAALLTAKLINALPQGGRASTAERDALWQSAALSESAPGYTLAEEGFAFCQDTTRVGMMSLRQCLGSVHDRFISELNSEYWRAVETGS